MDQGSINACFRGSEEEGKGAVAESPDRLLQVSSLSCGFANPRRGAISNPECGEASLQQLGSVLGESREECKEIPLMECEEMPLKS